jgi:membrane protein DedA with SNARE-associated domain
MQLLLLFGSWLLVCVGSHVCIRRYYLASLVAAVLCVAVTLYAGYAELGHPDPHWYIAAITGFFMAGIVALVTGLPFRVMRTLNREDHPE